MYSCLFTFSPGHCPSAHHQQQLASRHQIPVKGGGWWRHRITSSQGHTINSNVDNKKIGPVSASLTSPPVSDKTSCQVEPC